MRTNLWLALLMVLCINLGIQIDRVFLHDAPKVRVVVNTTEVQR